MHTCSHTCTHIIFAQLDIIWKLNDFNVFHIAFENFGNKPFITMRPLNKMDMGTIATSGVSLILGFHEMIFSFKSLILLSSLAMTFCP